MWLGEFSWGRNVSVTLAIGLESMEVWKYFDSCNGKWKVYHIILFYLEDVR